MSEEEPKPQSQEQPEAEQQVNPDQLTEEDQQTYNKMMNTLSKMNNQIQKVRHKMQEKPTTDKNAKSNEIADKLIQSKESSEIITKENLLTDITQSYEKVVIEVYSENSKLKKKVEEMAKIIKEQSNKIYNHAKKEQELIRQNQKIREELTKLKDQKIIMARGGHVNAQQSGEKNKDKDQNTSNKKKTVPNGSAQNQDFDFWSMPQNDYGKKKKDFVQDSNLWVNQKEVHESVFLTEEHPTAGTAAKKKK